MLGTSARLKTASTLELRPWGIKAKVIVLWPTRVHEERHAVQAEEQPERVVMRCHERSHRDEHEQGSDVKSNARGPSRLPRRETKKVPTAAPAICDEVSVPK